jgi:flagellar motor switch protein FliG
MNNAVNSLQKAAVLMVILGDEVASNIYRALPEREVQELTREIAELDYVSPELAFQVLEDFNRLQLTQEYVALGGTEYASRLLVKAFGEDGAKVLLEELERALEAQAGNLDSLQKADPTQLAKFVEGEHPQTIALVIAHLDAKQASSLLETLPERTRAEVVRRLAEMRQFSPEMANKVSTVLNKKLQSLGQQKQRGYAGFKAVADLLNRLEPAASKVILDNIELQDPKLALAIRNLMFTFEDLLTVADASIRELLANVDKKTLAMALKGASEPLKNHIFKCMSSRATDMLKEDMDVLGPVRAREVTHAQQELITVARNLEAAGKVVLKSDRDDEYLV